MNAFQIWNGFYLLLGSAGVWTQSLMLVKQALHHLRPQLFYFGYFSDMVSTFLPGMEDHDPSTSISYIVGILGKSHTPTQ
jgi:hypothetical protein